MTENEKKELIKIVVTIILLLIISIISITDQQKIILYILAYLIVGYKVLFKAVKNIFSGQIFDENFLMSIATIGALITGEYLEAVLVMLLYQIGELFQSYAVGKSRKSITELMDIRPDYANIEKNGKVEKVDPAEIKVGPIANPVSHATVIQATSIAKMCWKANKSQERIFLGFSFTSKISFCAI